MKLNHSVTYALRALVHLARHGDRPVSAEAIAGAAPGVPERFLAKVLRPLVSAGVLLSLRGPNGGYRLARPAEAVTLLDVVEALDGPVRGDVPRWDSGAAGKRLDARLQAACDEAAEAVRKGLRRVTVAGLAAGGED